MVFQFTQVAEQFVAVADRQEAYKKDTTYEFAKIKRTLNHDIPHQLDSLQLQDE